MSQVPSKKKLVKAAKKHGKTAVKDAKKNGKTVKSQGKKQVKQLKKEDSRSHKGLLLTAGLLAAAFVVAKTLGLFEDDEDDQA